MLPVIRVAGTRFVDDGGAPWAYVGADAFALFRRWLMRDGPAALVAPWLDELRAIAAAGGYDGPIVLRVFRFAGNGNAFALDPWSYYDPDAPVRMAPVTAFTDFCGERGFYVDWTCGDAQQVLRATEGPRGQQQHLNDFCAALVPCSNAFVETCNEPFKNGIDVGVIVPPKWGTYLRDSGAYGEADAWPYHLTLDYVSYHPRRDTGGLVWPKYVIDLFDSASALLTMTHVPAVLKEAIGASEADRANARSCDPAMFFRMGLVAAFCGVNFHSDAGMACDAPGPLTRACAEAYFAGVAGATKGHR